MNTRPLPCAGVDVVGTCTTHTHIYIHTVSTHYYRMITKHKVLISGIFIFGNIINEAVIGLPILWCIFPLIYYYVWVLAHCVSSVRGAFNSQHAILFFSCGSSRAAIYSFPALFAWSTKTGSAFLRCWVLHACMTQFFSVDDFQDLSLVLYYQTVSYMYLENTSQHLTDFSRQTGGVVKRVI